MILNETYLPANDVKIPKLGLGTWFIDDDKAAEAVRNAVKLSYRLIDTAQAYGNERGVGEGVRTCGVPREELFVASKVAAELKTYDAAMKSIDETLERMGLTYLDQMIIHSPQPWNEFRVEAYSPIAHGEALKNPAIAEMAKKYGVSAAQLCIRYVIQLGTVALPKTANTAHMESNAAVDFSISEKDMDMLRHMERIADYGEFNIFPVYSGKPLA